LLLLLVLLVGGGLVFLKGRSSEPSMQEGSASRFSDQEKTRIQEFWKRFREAENLRRQGRFEAAVELYQGALELDPDHERSLYHLANCLIELDRYLDSLGPLEHLVKIAPLSQNAHLQLGLVKSCPSAGAVFDLDAAERELRRAVEINLEESGALLRLAGVVLVQGHLDQASELYELANQSNFRAVEGYYVRAYVDWKNGREGPARALLQEAVRQMGQPEVVAGVPGEGDTHEGDRLPPTTIDAKRLVRPFWNGLDQRLAGEFDLEAEFAAMESFLSGLKRS
jgi:tetratricopeptide (TPR) repeat protein